VTFVLLTAFRLGEVEPLEGFFYLATMGVLSLLVMYVLTNVAAAWHLARRGVVEAVPPVIGVAVAGYVLYRNVWPPAPAPYPLLAAIVAAWLLVGVGLAATIGARALRPATPENVSEAAGAG
jgi:hypothetical protein